MALLVVFLVAMYGSRRGRGYALNGRIYPAAVVEEHPCEECGMCTVGIAKATKGLTCISCGPRTMPIHPYPLLRVHKTRLGCFFISVRRQHPGVSEAPVRRREERPLHIVRRRSRGQTPPVTAAVAGGVFLSLAVVPGVSQPGQATGAKRKANDATENKKRVFFRPIRIE